MNRHSAVNVDRDMDNDPNVEDLAYSEHYKAIRNNSYKRHSSPRGRATDTTNHQETRVKDLEERYHPSRKSLPEAEFPAHRPSSRNGPVNKNTSFPERPGSSLSISGPARPRSTRHAAGRNLKVHQASSGEEDDEVIADLLGTVRQYAQEIREIYAPMQKDEQERTRKRNKRNSRRKSKDSNKYQTEQSGKQSPPHFHLEVRAEVHKLQESMQDCNLGKGKFKQGAISNSRSHQTSPTNHTASLQVEEANLSSSWPRNNQMSTSLERYWSDVSGTKPKTVTSSSTKTNNRSKTPSEWSEASTVQHEKEMLNRAFQRINKPYGDPLIGNSAKSMPVSQIHEQVLDSRQSVIEVARQHLQAKQSALPSISIMAPPADVRNTSRRSSGGLLPLVPTENERPFSPITASAPPFDGEDFE